MTGNRQDETPILREDELKSNGDHKSETTRLKQEKPNKKSGLGVVATIAFLIGELAGSGILALPKAVVDAGWVGMVLIVICGVLAGYSGVILGRCWNMMQERWLKYQSDTRDPYPAMAEEAFGKPMRYAVRLSIYLLHFGASTIILLLASQNVQSILEQWGAKHIPFCLWVLIVVAFLTPLTWLGTPKDFWPLAAGAAIATVATVLLILIAIAIDPRDSRPVHSAPSFQSFFLSFGAIVFSYGGASAFPTIQHDMDEPTKFQTAASVSFTSLIVMFLPVAAAGYFAYGDAVKTNILQSLPPGGLRVSMEVLLTGHLVFSFVILFNPVAQDIEGLIDIPFSFNWRRVLLRTSFVGLILFTAQSVPHFGPIMSFIGGSAVTCTTFVLPPLLYLKLRGMKGDWPEQPLTMFAKVLNVIVIIVGIMGGIASTYSAILELTSSATFVPPCYLNMTAAEGH